MTRIKILIFLLIISFLSSGQSNERIIELESELKNTPAQDRLAEITFELSTLYEDSTDLSKAINYAETSIRISESINYTTKQIKGIHQLGNLHKKNKEFDKALNYHNQALLIAKEYSNQKAIAIAYINIGKVYTESKNENAAKENLLNAIKIGDKIKNPLIKSIANSALGDLNKKIEKYNISTQFYIESLDNSLQTDNFYLQGIAYKNIGLMQKKTNLKGESLASFNNALKKFELIDNKKELTEINFLLGIYYQNTKDFDNAIIYMKNSLGFAELSGYHEYIKKGYENLANVYEKNEDYKNAYNYLQYFSAIKDTKFISELEAQIAQIEIEKKNKEIALINQNNQLERNRTYILLVLAILILIFSLVLYYNLRQKNKINKELKLATAAAKKSKQEKEEFFAFTSHEIRTPLNAVVGMTQLLSKTTLSEIQNKYLKTIKTSAKNILFLVNDVLDLAKLEKGAIKLEAIDTSLAEIINDIEDSLSFKTNDKPVQLKTNIDSKIPNYIKGDPLRINQILLNLTDNAIKFTKKGEVSLNVDVLEEEKEHISIRFEVKDTGIGITKEKLSKIFESYEQANIDTTRNYGGTGLGLAITKQLIELMGSKIEIESKINSGTTFSFNINFKKSKTTQKPALSINQNQLEHISNIRILAVDDTDLNRSIFYDLIYSKENNVNVVLAENGEKAIEACQKHKFDVIMMDLQMPVLNGFETTQKLREDINNPNQNTPIIAMTAHVLEGVSERCEEVGMNDYISKPINISLLYKKIKQYIRTPKNTILENEVNNTKKVIPQKANIKTSNVDLTSLSELVGHQNVKIIKYIDLFLKNVPKDLSLLKDLFASKKWDECAKTAHKIKGNAGYMGINKAKELLIEIEKLKEVVAQEDKNNDIVFELEEVLKTASEDLISIKNNLII